MLQVFPVLDFNYSGLGQLISLTGVGVSSLIAAFGGIYLGSKGVLALKQGAQASQAGAAIAADTNKTINDPTKGISGIHTLVNSNMTRMFWALGTACVTILALVMFALREVGKTAGQSAILRPPQNGRR